MQKQAMENEADSTLQSVTPTVQDANSEDESKLGTEENSAKTQNNHSNTSNDKVMDIDVNNQGSNEEISEQNDVVVDNVESDILSPNTEVFSITSSSTTEIKAVIKDHNEVRTMEMKATQVRTLQMTTTATSSQDKKSSSVATITTDKSSDGSRPVASFMTDSAHLTCVSGHLIERLLKLPEVTPKEQKEIIAMLEKGFEVLDESLDVTQRNDKGEEMWTKITNKPEFAIYRNNDDDNAIKSVVGITEVSGCNTKQIFDFLFSWEYAAAYDKYLIEGKDVARIGNSAVIIYTSYQAIWPISNRDFCYVSALNEDKETGVVRVVMKSVDIQSCPPSKGFIRGEILQSGMKFEPLENGNIRVTAQTMVDPKGWIPTVIINKVLPEISVVAHLKLYMHRFLEFCQKNKFGYMTHYHKNQKLSFNT